MNARRYRLRVDLAASLGVNGHEAPRRKVVADRLGGHPAGVVPERGQLPPNEQVALFVQAAHALPPAPARWSRKPRRCSGRDRQLPAPEQSAACCAVAATMQDSPELPWSREPMIEISTGPSDGHQLVSVSHAMAGVAETGTLVLDIRPGQSDDAQFPA